MPQTAKPAAQLVHAYLFAQDGVGHRIDANAAMDWLRRPDGDDQSFIWLHFDSPHGIGSEWLRHIDLSKTFRDMLHDERRSSRLSHARHGLFAALNDVDYDPLKGAGPEVRTLWLSVRPRWLVSAWSQPMNLVERLRQDVDAGQPFHGVLSLVVALLTHQANTLGDILRGAATLANTIEKALNEGKLPRRADLGSMRRDLVRLQRLLAPEPASLFRLLNRPPHWAREEDLDALHLATENDSVVLRDMAGLQERVGLLEEEIAARVAERTNRSVFVLTAVTVMALPVTVVAALFGMNVGGLPLHDSAHGFAIALAIAMPLTALAYALIRYLQRG